MADENTKVEETKEPWYTIKSECFKKFLTVSAGTFVGVFLALSLYGAVNKPPIPDCAFKKPMMHHEFQMPPHHQFKHCDDRHFHHKFKHHQGIKKHHFNEDINIY